MKVFFFDRDGVINEDIGYLHEVEKTNFTKGVFDLVRYLKSINYEIIIVTNQSGISRGFYSESDFKLFNDWMMQEFKKNNADILDVFYCPHGPKENCYCRKPNPGLFLEAVDKYKIDVQNSWAIGDNERDINAANNAGINNTILFGDQKYNHKTDATYVLKSLSDIKKFVK